MQFSALPVTVRFGLHDAMLAAQSLQEIPTGTLRINAFASAAREVMAPLILSFLQRYPQVHIDLVTDGRLVDIVAAGFDMGLRPADLVPSAMIALSLGLHRSNAVVASPDFLRTHGKPIVPADLYRFRCIRARLPNNALFRWRFEKDGNALQIDVQGAITLDEPSLVRIAAQNGVGLGYIMEADVREDIAAGRLVRVLEDWTPSLAPLAFAYLERLIWVDSRLAHLVMRTRLGDLHSPCFNLGRHCRLVPFAANGINSDLREVA